MKLVYCDLCGDIFNLNLETKSCQCKNVFGKYTDEKLAEINVVQEGTAFPLGINNHSFASQLKKQKEKKVHDSKWGDIFEAFFVPQLATTIQLHVGGKLVNEHNAVRSNLSAR